jgi:hypothetical protein
MPDDPIENLGASFIELPVSGLCVRDGELQRRNDKGVIIARHKLASLERVSTHRKIDPTAIVFVLASVSLAIVCQLYVPSEVWSWVTFAAFMFVGLLCFFGITKLTIMVESADGNVRYDANDPQADVEGFVLSLQAMLTEGINGEHSRHLA